MGVRWVVAQAKRWESAAWWLKGQPARAEKVIGESIDVLHAVGDRATEANMINRLAVLHAEAGDLSDARANFEKARSIYSALGNRRWMADVDNNLGLLMRLERDLPGARKVVEEAYAVHLELGNKTSAGNNLANLSLILEETGDLASATATIERTVALYHSISDKKFEEGALAAQGRCHYLAGDLDRAMVDLQEARALDSGVQKAAVDRADVLAGVELARGNLREAEAAARQAVEGSRDMKDGDTQIEAFEALIDVLVAQGQHEKAKKELAAAPTDAELSPLSLRRLKILRLLIAGLSGDGPAGERGELEAMIADAKRVGFVVEEFAARLALARVELARGNRPHGIAAARSLARDARAHGFVTLAREAEAAVSAHRPAP
jgi:tetratricopeptide (TPR) repeat protein